ncbi:MAG: universal stress protein [Bacteroidetes bacterium QH_2_63_10]|nr:MAG: universal stress protein [Bacteroidetes bacterium QH_2_63_10]
MIYVDRILFPTDGSDCAERARRHALYLADHFDASLHVIHVEERDVELADVVEISEADLLADLHDMMGDRSPLSESRVQERTVAYPSAAGGILTYGVEHDVDLVVLGTHGKRGVRRLMLGSVAEEVVRKAPCPVATVGRGAIPPEDMEGGTMLVPVDFSEHRDRLLAHVRETAPVYGMTVTALHVVQVTGVPDAYGGYSSLPDPGKLGERAEEALADEVESLRAGGVDVSIAVKSGHPADQILTYAEESEAAFIMIATHGRTGLERMLMGSVAEKVIRRAPCPVCTVKSFGQSLVEEDDD